MSRFLDAHTVPGVGREAILQACNAMKGAPGVTFVACHYDLGERKIFCLTEAESEDVVRQAHANISLPYDSIRQVKVITPSDLA
ncbi:MAG: DUF4242 domain-containing protein [Acidobacteria bacterium]|nr:DUF4242 domain-containing protein [Acidobacteriota bacterium]